MDYSSLTSTELQHESDRVEKAIGEAEKCLADFRAMFAEIRSELNKRLKPAPEPRVSDHALLRYIERVMDVDVEQLRSRILTDTIKSALRSGATGVKVDGVSFIAKNGIIVTVVDKPAQKRKVRKGRPDVDDMEEQLLEVANDQ